MGGSSSKSTSKVITENVANTILQKAQSAGGSSVTKQDVYIKNSSWFSFGNKITVRQHASTSIVSITQTDFSSALKSAIQNTLTAKTGSTDGGIFSTSSASSATYSEIKNLNTSNTQFSDIQTTFAKMQSDQKAVIDNSSVVAINSGIEILQDTDMLVSAISKNTTINSFIVDAANKIDSIAKSETKNPIATIIDSVGGIISGIFSGVAMMWFGFILLIVAMVYIGYKLITTLVRGYDTPAQKRRPKAKV